MEIIDVTQKEKSSGQLTMMELWQKNIDIAKLKNEYKMPEMSVFEKNAKLKADIRAGKIPCPSCSSRTYADQSDDSSVSFQTPRHISPEQSKGVVLSHEREHVVNENAKARQEGREVLSSTVSLQYAKCPDCGASYVSGGLTSTVTKGDKKPENTDGANIDVKA